MIEVIILGVAVLICLVVGIAVARYSEIKEEIEYELRYKKHPFVKEDGSNKHLDEHTVTIYRVPKIKERSDGK